MSVSFIIPVFNKAPFLGQVLAAIASQKGDFAREYIFVDDGSTDNSLAEIRRLTEGWQNVTVVEKKNGGSASATNAGIRLARMEFIKFVDADDLLHEQATQILLDALQSHPDAVLAFGRRIDFDDGQVMDLKTRITDLTTTVITEPLYDSMKNSLFNPTQFLARTEAVKRSGGCDERVKHSQEYSLTLRLARLGTFVRVNALIAFINRGEGPRHGDANSRQLKRVNLALAYFLEDYPDTPLPLRRHAWKRAAGRAAKFSHRHRGQPKYSKLFWQNIFAGVVPQKDYVAAIRNTLSAFDEKAG